MVLLFDDDVMHLLSFPSFLIDLDLEFSTGQYVERGNVDYGTAIHWSIKLPSSHYMCYYY